MGNGDDGGDDAGNNAGEGDGGDAGGEGGGIPGRGRGGGGSSSGDGGDGHCILQGPMLFIVKIFLCGIFMMCGGIGEVTPPLTLSSCFQVCTYPRVLAKIFCSNVDTYKVDTYVFSD